MISINQLEGNTPLFFSSESNDKRGFRIMFAGDWCPRSSFGHDYYDDAFNSLLSSGDLNILNIEAVISDEPLIGVDKNGPNLKVNVIKSQTLRKFNLACLANNHSFDYGENGLRATIDSLSNINIDYVGASIDCNNVTKPYLVNSNEGRIAVINTGDCEYANYEFHGIGAFEYDSYKVCKLIHDLKKQVDVVIIIYHGGREYIPIPEDYIVSRFHKMIDYGADVIVGHHPHVPQGIEYYHSKPIIYSLGNFLYHQKSGILAQKVGYLFSIDIKNRKIENPCVYPYKIYNDRIELLKNDMEDLFLDLLSKLSKYCNDDEKRRNLINLYTKNNCQSIKTLVWLAKPFLLYLINKRKAYATFLNYYNSRAHRDFFIRCFKYKLEFTNKYSSIGEEYDFLEKWFMSDDINELIKG